MPSKNPFRSAKRTIIVAAMLFVFASISLIPEAAQAQSNSCSRLQRQLASLSSGSNSGGSARFRHAAKSQQKQINSVQSKMGRYGCAARRKLFAREKHASCRGLRSTLSKMKRNLKQLRRKAGGSGQSSKRQRRRIKSAMRRNRCGANDTRQARNQPSKNKVRRTSILEQIFGNSASKRRRHKRAERERRALRNEQKNNSRQERKNRKVRSTEEHLRSYNYNTVRTICVRTCDGYFFPVSFSTNKQSIPGDASACSNLCPGTEMKLYYHKTASQSSEQMISFENGKPYTSLPTAFAYQKSYNPSCSCNYRLLDRAKTEQQTAESPKEKRLLEQQSISRIAKPIWRTDKGQDPETLANEKGSFTQKALADLNTDKATDKRVAQTRKVRVVGDAYFPNQ